jgi:PAS domain S-box-containing protein
LQLLKRFPSSTPLEGSILRKRTRHESARGIRAALIESEERYRSIVTAMSEGIVMQDAQGRIIECNAAAERILGLTRDQMMGLTSLDPRWQATDAEGRPTRGEEHPVRVTLRTGEPQRDVVMGVRRAEGSRAWVRINTQPLFRPGESHPYSVVASFADITASREAEAALRESEERFRSLYAHSLDGVLLTAPDGSILAANPEACRLLGRTEAEICAAGRAGTVDGDDPRLAAFLDERSRTGKARSELTVIRADGARVPVEVSSAVFNDRDGNLRTSLSIRDISERKQAEAALRQANETLEARVVERTRALAALLEISREVAAQLDLAPLLARILAELKGLVDYTGAAVALLEEDETVILDYAGPARRAAVLGARAPLDRDSCYRQVIESRRPLIIEDLWADCHSSDAIWPECDARIGRQLRYARSWLGVPLMAQGRMIGLLRLDHAQPGYFTPDHVERALAFGYQVAVAIGNAKMHEAAQRAAALAERERLSRDLHDSVSQALYGIALGVEAARGDLKHARAALPARLDFIWEQAQLGLAEMRALIFELRPDALARDGLSGALERHADLLRSRHNARVETRLEREPDLPLGAKEALYRIAQEASNNAARHADARTIFIRLRCEGGAAMLEVEDDGRGFDPARPYPGHLGLRSMRERAEQIGAEWDIKSAEGCGTRVRVCASMESETSIA